jgi:hypothetical protein
MTSGGNTPVGVHECTMCDSFHWQQHYGERESYSFQAALCDKLSQRSHLIT